MRQACSDERRSEVTSRTAQALLHSTLRKLFTAQPADPLAFIIEELQVQKQLRDHVEPSNAADSKEPSVEDRSIAPVAPAPAPTSGTVPENLTSNNISPMDNCPLKIHP